MKDGSKTKLCYFLAHQYFFQKSIMRPGEDNSYLNAIPAWIGGLLQRKQHHEGETAKNGNYRCPWLMARSEINSFFLSHSVHILFFWKGTALHGSQGLQCVLLFAALGSFSWCTSSLGNPKKVPGIWKWLGILGKITRTLPVKGELLTFNCYFSYMQSLQIFWR